MAYSMGVDIGGTKIAAGIIDKNGICLYRIELASIKMDREAMFEQVVLCIEKLLTKSQLSVRDLEGIGIGVPGKVDVENGIAVFQNNLPWANFPLVDRIKEQFPVQNVVIDNDVYMAAFAEWVIHGKNPKETFVYLTISTGISCCTIHNGNFIRGSGFAGEIGLLPVIQDPLNGDYQNLESIASGPGIAKLAIEKLSTGNFPIYENAAKITTEKILEDFKIQQSYAVSTVNEIFDYLAKGLYNISCLLDPNKLVLGGGVINHHPELLEFIKASLGKYLLPDQANLLKHMTVSRLESDAGLIGSGLRVNVLMNAVG